MIDKMATKFKNFFGKKSKKGDKGGSGLGVKK